MKILQKKHGLFAVTAVLLTLMAILVTIGCNNIIGSEGDNTDGFTPPPGKGAVRINFSGFQRTIMPSDSSVTIATFDEFKFDFTDGSGTVTTMDDVAQTDKDTPIVLVPGTYELVVTGYLGTNNATRVAAAQGSLNNIVIEATKVTAKTITLSAIADGTEEGTFEYTIETDIAVASINSALIKFTPISGIGYGSITPIDLKSKGYMDGSSHTDDETVKSGYYYLDFEIKIKIDATLEETVTFRHVVHVYANLTSSYSFTISEDYFHGYLAGVSGVLLGYTNIADTYKPVLTYTGDTTGAGDNDASGLAIAEATGLTIKQGCLGTITVTNASAFSVAPDTLVYYKGDTTPITISGGTIAVNTTTLFNLAKTRITVVGIKNNVPYSFTFDLIVTP